MPWVKGLSGNPSGRPKDMGAIKDLARQHTAAAIETLVKALKAKGERTRVAAAEALLDRGWGRPQQDLNATISIFDALGYAESQRIERALTAIVDGTSRPAESAEGSQGLQ